MADRNISTTQKENNAVCGKITEEDRKIHSGDLFLHFKNKMYQVVTIATHSETEETLVIYQAMYGDYKVFARPLELFLSEVDHEKYPDVTQKYRFEKVKRDITETIGEEKKVCRSVQEQSKQERADVSRKDPESREQPESEGTSGDEEQLESKEQPNKWLMKFLSADTYDEKSSLLKDIEGEMTDRLINNLAAALDVVIPEGPIAERYRQLRICVDTKKRYETGRLR